MCPDWESNWWPFDSQTGTQPLSYTSQGLKESSFERKLQEINYFLNRITWFINKLHIVNGLSLVPVHCQQESPVWSTVKKETWLSANQVNCDTTRLWCGPGARQPWGQAPLWLDSSSLFLTGLLCSMLVCFVLCWLLCAGLLCSIQRSVPEWYGLHWYVLCSSETL